MAEFSGMQLRGSVTYTKYVKESSLFDVALGLLWDGRCASFMKELRSYEKAETGQSVWTMETLQPFSLNLQKGFMAI